MRAKHGDCLLLHCGTSDDPRMILIDGGPSGIFNSTLKPRLAEIATTLGMDTLPLDLVMVSHIDDDHINGIKEKQPHVSAVIASVPQGRKVRKNAKTLGLEVNRP
jgi:metal-dependent hydrolase (beta-lactamase superfamily II)